MNVTPFSANITSFAPIGAAFAASVLIQTTAVLAVGLAIARMLRHRGAAVQSAWYRILLVAAMLAPCAWALLGVAVARVHIPIPFMDSPVAVAVTPKVLPVPSNSQTLDMAEAPTTDSAMLRVRPPFLPREGDIAPTPVSDQIVEANTPMRAESPPAATGSSWSDVAMLAFCAAWLLLSAILVGRIAYSIVVAMRLIRSATEAEPQLVARCRQLAADLRARPPSLRRSPFVTGACVFGWRRPVILLSETDPVTGDDVLIHELAHVVRRDCLWKLLAECAVAVLWFQPLLWRLKSRMQECAEDVCDDYVVGFGADRCEYADRLTRIAEHFVPLRIQAGIGIVSVRSSLRHRVIRILDSSRRLQTEAGRKTVAGLLCGAAVVLAVSLIDFGAQPNRATAAATGVASTPAATGQLKLTPAKEEHGDVVTIRGQVLRPDGRPAVGAKVSAIWCVETREVMWRPIAAVTTGANGLFELVYRKSQFSNVHDRADEWKYTTIEVDADGCAVECRYWSGIDAAKPLVFKLLPDFPIHGSVLDLQGQPVGGVAVSLLNVAEPRNGSLDSWLERIKGTKSSGAAGGALFRGGTTPPRERTDAWTVTDRDGRFVMRGIAAERLVTVSLGGETIAWKRLLIVTRNMPVARGESEIEYGIDKVYGADFTDLVDPGRSVFGTVKDAGTGQPLAGIGVEILRMANKGSGGLDIRVFTDAKGQYRLIGMPYGKGNQLLLRPNYNQPYLTREVKVPAMPGLEPLKFDIQLHRGLWISGRATDKATGQPVIARLYYLPFRNNSYASRLPEFKSNSIDGEDTPRYSREDGTFRIVGLPGRAIVGGWTSTSDRYRMGVGASEIQGIKKDGKFPTYGYFPAGNKWPEVLKEINPREGVEEVHCDLVFDPGQAIHASLIDRNGKAVDGSTVMGWCAWGNSGPKPSKFDVICLSPGDKRRLLIRHDQLNIGKFLQLDFTDKTPSSMTITLEPCAMVTGRIVDQDGSGLKGSLQGYVRPAGDHFLGLSPVATQPDGHFKVALPPGCQYGLNAEVRGYRPGGAKIDSVEPGKTIDVGEIKLQKERRRR